MKNFWLQFAIQEALAIASTFVQSTGINPVLKTALENFIAAGQSVVAAL